MSISVPGVTSADYTTPQQYGLYGILWHPKYFVTDLYKDWVGGTGRGNDQMSDAI